MKTLFDTSVTKREWTTLKVEGFSKNVAGVVFTASNPPCCGVPLGGIGTGCIDFDTRGVFGWSSIFNPYSQTIEDEPRCRMPRKIPNVQPIFALSTGGEVHVLATREYIEGGKLPWCTAPLDVEAELDKPRQDFIEVAEIKEVKPVKEIFYYGHFPVADAEYVIDAPVSVGVRAWAPFIPGNSTMSNIPAAVFEVYVRNTSDKPAKYTFAMNFPGPDHQESRGVYFNKQRIEEDAIGVFVASEGNVNYFMGVLGGENVRVGTGLQTSTDYDRGYGKDRFTKTDSWKDIASSLPKDDIFIEINGQKLYKDPSTSVAVDFSLAEHEEKKLEFILCWYAPTLDSIINVGDAGKAHGDEKTHYWIGNKWHGRQSYMHHMYAVRYSNALDVMRRVAEDKDRIFNKILAWQEVLLTHEDFPIWLRDSLLNILCLLTEDGYWFQPRYPVGDWAYPNGVFIYYESPRDCPHSNCIPNDFIGTMHLSYFFPDLYLQLLRSYKALQRADGEIPFSVGKSGDLPGITQPEYTWQMSLNSSCYIFMVDRFWKISGNNEIVHEFYDSIKKCNDYVTTLSEGENSILRMPDKGGSEWFEFSNFYGITSHVGGLHLSQLLIVERMARFVGDNTYADKCRAIYEENRQVFEDKLWNGTHYFTYIDEENNRINDNVMAYQLDGYFTNMQTGIHETIFDPGRIQKVLETVWNSNVKLGNGYGALNYARANGSYITDDDAYGKNSIFAQNTIVLAMTYMYTGQYERGMELAYNTWRNEIIKQGLGWDMTHIVNALDGRKMFGADYNQQSVIWSLPSAMRAGDLSDPCKPGGVVFEILRAASK